MKTILTILQRIILPCICLVLTLGCSESDAPDAPQSGTGRTILVYMVANNNLSYYASLDFTEMQQGMAELASSTRGRLLVYFAPYGGTPQLREVMRDGTYTTLVSYTDGTSSVDVEHMRGVIRDVMTYAPADSYGLVLWSHGTGWLHDMGTIEPDNDSNRMNTYSFGWDGTPAKKMSIESLNRAISDVDWDFIYFDCCHMGTVEVAYELRDRAPAIVASATELGLEGMPYHRNVEPLFAATPDLDRAVHNTFSFYSNLYSAGSGYGCSISLIHTAALNDLADITREVFETSGPTPGDYVPVRYFRPAVMTTGIFDMHHYINALCTDSELLDRWNDTFSATVATHLTTTTVYDLPAADFHGLGSHIVGSPDYAEVYNYKATSWWVDVVSHAFNQDNQ